MAYIGWIHPSHRNDPHQDCPAGYHTYHDEEDVLVHHDLQRSGRLEGMPENDRAESPDRPAESLRDPPTYEEALLSLGRAPTKADLGPQSPESRSTSLMPYATEGDSDPEEIQEQQEGTLEQMETDEQDTTEPPVKRRMGISTAPEDYQPAPPRYIKAGENSEDEENGQDEEEDLPHPQVQHRRSNQPRYQ